MARKTIEEAGLAALVLVDEIDNLLWCTYGRMPNNAYLIGMDGRVVTRQEWNNPTEMDSEIRRYLEERP